MTGIIDVADMKNPETGLTYREENNKLVHNIPVGALVEITYSNSDEEQNEYGLRLFVQKHVRDCDGTPLYALTSLTPYRWNLNESVFGKDSVQMNGFLSNGHSEESLKIIRLPDGTYPITTDTTGYIVHGSTGCSCCRDSNFVDGIFDTLIEAMESAESDHKRSRVASQYSRNGIYTIREIKYETLVDGRIILNDRVYTDKNSLYENWNAASELESFGVSQGTIGGLNLKG